ncbi:MAG: TetR-like C-terminal domain-containing protein [Capnocytophaga felis]|nr:TetR-like C-terminal domain-containing protein [Capnocytophaga felis]
MPKSTTITKEMIVETAFEMVRKEGFMVLSARNIAKQIGCSTQPIYCCYKTMDELKAEVCQKVLAHLKNRMCSYQKTGNVFLDLGLGYVRMAHTEPALFKAIYIDNITNVKLVDIFPENQEIVELIKSSEEYRQLSEEEAKNGIAKAWMLVHGIASLVAVGMFVYDEEKILEILK